MMDSSLVDFVILQKSFFFCVCLMFYVTLQPEREREAEQTQGGHKTAETEHQAIKRFGSVIITLE